MTRSASPVVPPSDRTFQICHFPPRSEPKYTCLPSEAKLGPKASAAAKDLIGQARKLASTVPITEKESTDPSIAGAFQVLKAGQKAAGRQAEFESRWDAAALKNYTEARQLAERALTAK